MCATKKHRKLAVSPCGPVGVDHCRRAAFPRSFKHDLGVFVPVPPGSVVSLRSASSSSSSSSTAKVREPGYEASRGVQQPPALDVALDFLFGVTAAASCSSISKRKPPSAANGAAHGGSGEEEASSRCLRVVVHGTVPSRPSCCASSHGVGFPLLLEAVASLMPAGAMAVHAPGLCGAAFALGSSSGSTAALPIVPACLPLSVPFSLPALEASIWINSKRALALRRCSCVAIHLQGAVALFQMTQGDLVGGFFDVLMAIFGNYGLQPESISMFPSYVAASGLAGVLSLGKTYWIFHEVPLRYMPAVPYLPGGVALLSAYLGYKLCKEVRCLAMGYPGGDEESWLVRLGGAEWWPASAIAAACGDGHRTSGHRARFNPFAGDGNRLGGGSPANND